MDVKRGVLGPRGFAQAMSGGGSRHDVYTCPHLEEDWHNQVLNLNQEARDTASARLTDILLQEAEEILQTRKATK